MLYVRNASTDDFDRIMEIYSYARDFMIRSGNPTQWGHSHPNPELIEADIDEGICRVICESCANPNANPGDSNPTADCKVETSMPNGIDSIHGVFVVVSGIDPTYLRIYDGEWLNDEPYVTIHRLAGDGKAHGLFRCAFDYCKGLSSNVRVDTHENNHVMQRLIEKNGFIKCGTIYISDGSPRIAYHWSDSI